MSKTRKFFNSLFKSARAVEIGSINDTGKNTLTDANQSIVYEKSNVLNDLLNGIVTEEVQALRSSYYLNTIKSNQLKIKSIEHVYNEETEEYDVTNVSFEASRNHKRDLEKIKGDGKDTEYPVMLYINNDNYDDEVGNNQYYESKLEFDFGHAERIEINKFIESIIVRRINEKEALLELKIPNRDYDRHTTFKMFANNFDKEAYIRTTFLFKKFETTLSGKDIGNEMFSRYVFENPKIHSVTLCDENNYTMIVKLKVDIETDGDNIAFAKYIRKEDIEKYNNNIKKDIPFNPYGGNL